jgi:FixJ family two-component response regulator
VVRTPSRRAAGRGPVLVVDDALNLDDASAGVVLVDGLTDHEIAARLVVSVRTVESHLARTYRKLGIASCRELGTALQQGKRGS